MIFPSIYWYVQVAYFASNEYAESNIEFVLQQFHRNGVATTITELANFKFYQQYHQIYGGFYSAPSGLISIRDRKYIWNRRNEGLFLLVRNYYDRTEILTFVRNSTQLSVTKEKISLCDHSGNEECLKIGNYKRSINVLKGTTRTIVTQKKDFIVEFTRSGKDIVFINKGYASRMILLAAKKLKIEWKVVAGSPFMVNNWDLCTYGDRHVDWMSTYYFMEFDYVAVVQAPEFIDKATALFEPFEWMVWAIIGANFIVSTFVLYGIINVHQKIQKGESVRFGSIIFLLYLTFLNQDGQINNLPGRATKLFISIWIFSSLILTWSYAGVVLSSLAHPAFADYVSDYDKLLEVAKSRSQTIGMVKNSGLYHWTMTINSETDPFKPLRSNVKDNDVHSLDDAFSKVLGGNFILVIEEYTAWVYTKMLGEKYFRTFDIPVGIYRVPFYIDYHSPYKYELLDLFNRMLKFGIDVKCKRDEALSIVVPPESRFDTADSKFKPITLKDLRLPFMLLLIGYALGTIVLCFEKTCHAIKNRKTNVKPFNQNKH